MVHLFVQYNALVPYGFYLLNQYLDIHAEKATLLRKENTQSLSLWTEVPQIQAGTAEADCQRAHAAGAKPTAHTITNTGHRLLPAPRAGPNKIVLWSSSLA